MCGIAGIVMPDGRLGPAMLGQAVAMADALQHRGPDEAGLNHDERSVLAVRRLAIIDLATGQQPVFNEDRTVWAVLNGEIFNYRALQTRLRRSGHRLRSAGDSEVLVHLYEERGVEFLHDLEGQFALALWDAPKRRLLLARDRMGICPLFYVRAGGALYFASEIKALLAGDATVPAVDEAAVAQVACLGCVLAPRTMFRGVKALLPASCLTFDGKTETSREYWRLHFPVDADRPRRPLSFHVEELSRSLSQAVERTLVSDVPIGTFLSGGVDSGLVTAMAARAAGPLPAYSIVSPYRVFDERAGIDRTARRAGVRVHALLADDALIARRFPEFIWHAETPVLSTEGAALMALAAEARKDVKVVLSGEGADEAFAGYLAMRQFRAFGALNRTPLSWLRPLLSPSFRAYYGSDFLLPSAERRQAIRDAVGFLPAQLYEYEFYRALVPLVFRDEWAEAILARPTWADVDIPTDRVEGRHWLDQSLYLGYRVMLPNYLLAAHGDRVVMAQSVEARYPFLDREVVETAASMPPELKLHWTREKFVLRCVARQWLPDDVALAPKRRFMTPFGTPFLTDQAPELIRALLSPELLREYGYFDPQRVSAVIAAMGAQTRHASRLRTRRHLERLSLGIALTLTVSLQLFHHFFVAAKDRPSLRRTRSVGATVH